MSVIALAEADLQPLLVAARRLEARAVTVFGSAAHRPLTAVGDVDVHVVLPRLERAGHDAVVDAGRRAAAAIAARLGKRPRLELRHGPFKPAPHVLDALQLHLVVDDAASLARTPAALLLHRAATGRAFLGALAPPAPRPAVQWLDEALREIARWRDAIRAREIPFRRWQFDPFPRLTDRSQPARSDWELRCLLRAASASCDLVYATALRSAGATDETGPEPGTDVSTTLEVLTSRLEQLGRVRAGV